MQIRSNDAAGWQAVTDTTPTHLRVRMEPGPLESFVDLKALLHANLQSCVVRMTHEQVYFNWECNPSRYLLHLVRELYHLFKQTNGSYHVFVENSTMTQHMHLRIGDNVWVVWPGGTDEILRMLRTNIARDWVFEASIEDTSMKRKLDGPPAEPRKR